MSIRGPSRWATVIPTRLPSIHNNNSGDDQNDDDDEVNTKDNDDDDDGRDDDDDDVKHMSALGPSRWATRHTDKAT